MLSACQHETPSDTVISSRCKALTDKDKDLLRTFEILNAIGVVTPADDATFEDTIKTMDIAKLDNTLMIAAYCSPRDFDLFLKKTITNHHPEIKARIFMATANAVARMNEDENSIFHFLTGKKDNISAIIARMTEIINSEPRGIVGYIYKNDMHGSAKELIIYMSELMRHHSNDGENILGKILSQLQGVGSGISVIDFFGSFYVDDTGNRHYTHAEALGYYAAALQLGIDSMNLNFTKTVATVNSILDSAISFGDETGSFSRGKISTEDINQANGNKKIISLKLLSASIPLNSHKNPYSGLALSYFKKSAIKVFE